MESSTSSLISSTGTLSSLGERGTSRIETSPGRQHSESVGVQTDSDHVQEYVMHADLWFLDGSVILRAENTLFRVHISQLSRHSTFFRDLFSLPQPPRGVRRRTLSGSSSNSVRDDGLLEGCPVVYLYDIAEDVGNLLTALYDGPYVPPSVWHGRLGLIFCPEALVITVKKTFRWSPGSCGFRQNICATLYEPRHWHT